MTSATMVWTLKTEARPQVCAQGATMPPAQAQAQAQGSDTLLLLLRLWLFMVRKPPPRCYHRSFCS
jgi:hypothetical protein